MGRGDVCGHTSCDHCLFPRSDNLLNYLPLQYREVGKRKTIVIVAEGAQDRLLRPIRAEYVKEVLTERLGLDTRVTTLGHIQRGGRPCAFDRILVSSFGLLLRFVSAICDAITSRPCKDSKLLMLCWRQLLRLLRT